ncbi:hypothetical protein [Streptomyces sp. HNM0574]|uniref:hypothetical protein n=1 Tax=Streptomyces sp. HNM0574 TaxID=2714954 RepID=UPI00146B32E5|nr:hypothetical protein [Streptomyces sp. HNM0574]NLU68391.1 hypothetical protein [Streptomyces sp. HNM0574]
MPRWLGRAFGVLGEVALAVDAGSAIRHGQPVTERAYRRCTRPEVLTVPRAWLADGPRATAHAPVRGR